MNRKKLFTVGLLSVLVLFSAFAGGQQSESTEPVIVAPGPFGKYSPPLEVTAFKITKDQMSFQPGEDLNNNIWAKLYEEELGIKVNYEWTVADAQAQNKVNVQIAAADLPDISTVDPVQFKSLYESGMIQDLTQVWDEYASPLVKQIFEEEDGGVALGQVSIDGKLYGIPKTRENLDAVPLIYIRADWLENLGLAVPRTIDELEAAARAFAFDDPDGNGEDDTLGISFTGNLNDPIGGMNGLFMGFGAYPYLNGAKEVWLNDPSSGEVISASVQPEVRQTLETLSRWYEEGILDREFATRDLVKISELASNGRLGIVYAEHWFQWMWPMPMAIINVPEAEWITIEIPTVDGSPAEVVLPGSLDSTIYVANSSMKNPEVLVKMLNLYVKQLSQASPDYAGDYHVITKEDGEKFITWHYGLVQSGTVGNAYGTGRIQEWYKNRNTDYHQHETAWVADMIDQIRKHIGDHEEPGDNMWNWTTWMWGNPEGAYSINLKLKDEGRTFINAYLGVDTETMADRISSLASMREEVFTRIIMGGQPISAFDTYVQDWYKLGGEKILGEINDL